MGTLSEKDKKWVEHRKNQINFYIILGGVFYCAAVFTTLKNYQSDRSEDIPYSLGLQLLLVFGFSVFSLLYIETKRYLSIIENLRKEGKE